MSILIDRELKQIDILKDEILLESEKQINKWGIQERSPFEWMVYLMEEVGELSEAISEYEYRDGDIREIRKEGIQVVTLALKIIESYDYVHEVPK